MYLCQLTRSPHSNPKHVLPSTHQSHCPRAPSWLLACSTPSQVGKCDIHPPHRPLLPSGHSPAQSQSHINPKPTQTIPHAAPCSQWGTHLLNLGHVPVPRHTIGIHPLRGLGVQQVLLGAAPRPADACRGWRAGRGPGRTVSGFERWGCLSVHTGRRRAQQGQQNEGLTPTRLGVPEEVWHPPDWATTLISHCCRLGVPVPLNPKFSPPHPTVTLSPTRPGVDDDALPPVSLPIFCNQPPGVKWKVQPHHPPDLASMMMSSVWIRPASSSGTRGSCTEVG